MDVEESDEEDMFDLIHNTAVTSSVVTATMKNPVERTQPSESREIRKEQYGQNTYRPIRPANVDEDEIDDDPWNIASAPITLSKERNDTKMKPVVAVKKL